MDIREIQQLKKKLDDEHRKNSEAIDRVMKLLRDNSDDSSNSQSENQEKQSENQAPLHESFVSDNSNNVPTEDYPKNLVKKRSGGRGAVYAIYEYLPTLYTKKDAIDLVKEHKPQFAKKMTPDTVAGAMKALVEDGLAKVEEEASGRTPVKYRKTMD
ncbi:MAG: hypothetical protein ACR2LT_09200 [Pyrinomonadaceae bacterium]